MLVEETFVPATIQTRDSGEVLLCDAIRIRKKKGPLYGISQLTRIAQARGGPSDSSGHWGPNSQMAGNIE